MVLDDKTFPLFLFPKLYVRVYVVASLEEDEGGGGRGREESEV